nr:immunoglobulin light chain junction region [Macaca mulatta]MOV35520.1 immunoglobulin light chain junction region [Macaca mulatta]MOV35534.1 immunoglobulin light chain junction region [Macaca mulatta]MOV35567.1 immunoglobulin light chain junction region [Macaca mulatta]
CMQGAQLPYSF